MNQPLHSDSPVAPDWRSGLLALSPVALFLALYLVVSAVLADFYAMPVSVALMAGCMWAVAIARRRKLSSRLELLARSAAQPDVLYMIWIFILAGAFAALAKGIGAVDAAVAVTLRTFPAQYLLAAVFVAACVVSVSIGTSVGTVVALTPLAVDMAASGGGDVAVFTAAVLGGAFFGDNLSFISDTTIAATRTQGCRMSDKFWANCRVVIPAAIVAIGIYVCMADSLSGLGRVTVPDAEPVLAVPYLLVLVLAVCGVNVALVLTAGIVAALALGFMKGMDFTSLAALMGDGIDGMGQLVIVTLMAAGMLGIVKAMGGLDWLMRVLTHHVRGERGARMCIALLSGAACVCTANNTVAILTVGPMSRDIAARFGVDPRRSASLLDTASCIVQCLIPYGAQTLLATALAGITAVAPWPYLYYPWALTAAVAVSILLARRRAD